MRLVIFVDVEGDRVAVHPLTGEGIVFEKHDRVQKDGEPGVFVSGLDRCITLTFDEAVEKVNDELQE